MTEISRRSLLAMLGAAGVGIIASGCGVDQRDQLRAIGLVDPTITTDVLSSIQAIEKAPLINPNQYPANIINEARKIRLHLIQYLISTSAEAQKLACDQTIRAVFMTTKEQRIGVFGYHLQSSLRDEMGVLFANNFGVYGARFFDRAVSSNVDEPGRTFDLVANQRYSTHDWQEKLFELEREIPVKYKFFNRQALDPDIEVFKYLRGLLDYTGDELLVSERGLGKIKVHFNRLNSNANCA